MYDLISVIVPIYNKEKYIKECIESILGQTYSKLQIILINDGSTDDSEKICQKYADTDNRIQLITTENHGAACARNTGIDLAKGDYISFIDADDYIDKQYYEILLQLLKKHDAEVAECGLEMIEEGKCYKFPAKTGKERVMNRKEILVELYGKDDEEHIKTVIMCNKLFKRKLFNNVRYIPGRVIDDETVIYRLLEQCQKVVESKDILYGYVQSDNSVMRKDFSAKRLEDSIAVYDECIAHFEKEPDIQACCLKRAIFFYGEFLEKIANSDSINKQKAFQKVQENFIPKKQMLERLQTQMKEQINYEAVITTYEKNAQKYVK